MRYLIAVLFVLGAAGGVPAGAAIQPMTPIAAARAASRLRRDPETLPSVSECATPRGVRGYGSKERCLQALCAGQNVVNTFVTDETHRLRRNPCVGVDPFERP